MTALVSLAVFSGLSLNLILQFGLGIRNLGSEQPVFSPFTLFQWLILFLSVYILWLFFFYALSPLGLGILEPFLLFPLSSLVCVCLEMVFSHAFPRKKPELKLFNPLSSYNGLALCSLMLTLRLALSPVEALVLSMGFALGALFAVLILNEIRKRSFLEILPASLRGTPLIFISMGLLSLIFSAAAAIFLSALGVF
jgi:electron transport complex protein RnfA